jgi:endonuclease/exonuclease/phosphatase family metal-dependent hydrolase
MMIPSLPLRSPVYYASDDGSHQRVKKHSLVTRTFYNVLPFLALHRPLGRIITVTMDSSRTISSFSQLLEKKDRRAILQTCIAIAALASTVFMHPLGLCIATLYDLIANLPEAIAQLQTGDVQGLILILQHGLYLGTILIGSVEIIAVSLLLSMAIEIHRSRRDFQQGYLLEGVSHLLMSMVRFGQSVPYMTRAAEQKNLRGQQLFKSLEDTSAKIRNSAALCFYFSARFLLTPFWNSTSSWLKTVSDCNNPLSSTSHKIFSVAKSAFCSCSLFPLILGGLALGHALHFTAFILSTTPYIHLRGDANIRNPSDPKLSIFQLNCCLTAGGFARLFGGLVLPEHQRIQKIADMIREQNPNILLLQEVSDLQDAYSLYRRVSSQFTDFYLGIGPSPWILPNNSGLFVASNRPITSPEFHSFSDIPGVEPMVNKGFFSFSTPRVNIINTHLSPSSNTLHPTDLEIQTREEEQRRVMAAAHAQFSKTGRNVLLSADCNGQQGPLFDQCAARSTSNPQAACETDFLVARNQRHDATAHPGGPVIDYIFSLFQAPITFNTRVIPTFHVDHPEEAISDHPALLSEITLSS